MNNSSLVKAKYLSLTHSRRLILAEKEIALIQSIRLYTFKAVSPLPFSIQQVLLIINSIY